MGSKNRIAKYIVPIIQKYIDNNNITTYYEPFVGGANIIDKIKCENRIGNDIHKELIAMLKKLQDGWEPPSHITEEEYNLVKNNKEQYPDYYVGFVGFMASFSAKYFAGYARGYKNDGITPRDSSNESIRNILRQVPNLKSIQFICSDYLNNQYNDLKNSVIYCDPPYFNTTKYSTGKFDYNLFWEWCRKMSENNYVFVSEYNAPDDFVCIWSKDTLANFDCSRGTNNTNKKRVEKLFVHSSMKS